MQPFNSRRVGPDLAQQVRDLALVVLFAAVILDKAATVADEVFETIADALRQAHDVRAALHDLAYAFLDGLLTPDVIRMRRLVIAEADRFPDIARTWFDRGFERALPIVGEALSGLASRGMLHNLSDPVLAAYQFAGLVMYQPMNYVMFAGVSVTTGISRAVLAS